MAFKLIWSPSARHDLKDIAAYIAEDSPSVGRPIREEPISGCGEIGGLPGVRTYCARVWRP
jgi:hypothetical protein